MGVSAAPPRVDDGGGDDDDDDDAGTSAGSLRSHRCCSFSIFGRWMTWTWVGVVQGGAPMGDEAGWMTQHPMEGLSAWRHHAVHQVRAQVSLTSTSDRTAWGAPIPWRYSQTVGISMEYSIDETNPVASTSGSDSALPRSSATPAPSIAVRVEPADGDAAAPAADGGGML